MLKCLGIHKRRKVIRGKQGIYGDLTKVWPLQESVKHLLQGLFEILKEGIYWNPDEWKYLHMLTEDWNFQYYLYWPLETHMEEAYDLNATKFDPYKMNPLK